LRVRLKQATALLCGALLTPLAGAAETAVDHSQHAEELSPTVITGIAPSSPLTIVTNPKDPRQPVPASDGGDYLKTIPGFALVRNGGTNGDPVLRGMFGSRLNILTNGSMLLGACPGRMDAPTSYISPETYDTLTLQGKMLGDDAQLLVDNLIVQVQKFNGSPIGVQFPPHVELTVTATEPGTRGNTASGSVTKTATLETGLEVQVPLFIKEGEKIRVHTETREFAGRA
jgi:hypothetical protein